MFPPRMVSSLLGSRRAPVLLALVVAATGIVLTTVNVYQLRAMQAQLLALLPDGEEALFSSILWKV